MIGFKNITGKNFLSIGADSVSFRLDDIHTTIIRGTNGAGKTTLLDMLCYGLFNKPLRKVKLDQLVNSVNRKAMLVTVEFSVNGKNYTVERGQKPAIFIITEDGIPIKESANARDQQQILEDILGCNYTTFVQSVIIASTGYTNFMELPVAQRREMVEKMLDLEIIGGMVEELKIEKKSLDKQSSMIDSEHHDTRRSIEHQQDLIKQLSNNSGELIADLDHRIEECDKGFDDSKVLYETIIAEKPNIDIEAGRIKYAELKKLDNEYQKEINECNISIRDFVNGINMAQSKVLYYTKNTVCDTCKQQIDKSFAEDIINSQNDAINAYKNDQEMTKTKLTSIGMARDECIKNINKITDQAGILNIWQTKCNDAISTGNRWLSKKAEYVSQKEALLNKGTNDTKKFYEQIDVLESQLKDIAIARGNMTDAQENLVIASHVLKDNGLKAKIVKQYLPLINEYINDYLEIMGANYSFNLDSSFNETILSRYRDNFSYHSFSNGERQRINMAIVFAWRKLAAKKHTVSSNLLLLDEILDGSLDWEGIDGVMKIFDTMTDSNLFVVSHRTEIVELFDQVYTVEKIGNFSNYSID